MKHITWVAIVLSINISLRTFAEPNLYGHLLNQSSSPLVSAIKNQKPVLFARPQNIESEIPRNPNLAFLYSLLIPGYGQIYSKAKRGYGMIVAEMALLTSYYIIHNNAKSDRDHYRDQVRKHVRFDGGCGGNLESFSFVHSTSGKRIEIPCAFDKWDPVEDVAHSTAFSNWRNIYNADTVKIEEQYRSINELNKTQILEQLQRLDLQQLKTLERVGLWYWEDLETYKDETKRQGNNGPPSKQRQTAYDLRNNANDKFERAKVFLGLVMFNHIVSAVDARIAARNYNKTKISQSRTQLSWQIEVSPLAIENRVLLRKSF